MSNIFDYMDWRDILLTDVPFNEVDNLILSRLSYLPFDGIVNNTEITLEQAYRDYKLKGTTGRIIQKEDIDIFPKIALSKRFGKIKLINFVNQLDPVQEKQFSAITIILPDDTIFVSYRGTDLSIIGWKEDFNMCFSELIPAQIDAVAYLEKSVENYSQNIRIGGHSKGGNLAIYAAAFCNSRIQERIINVYNNDGPGFHENVIQSKEYQSILDKVHTFIPQTSIIGRLLEHKEKCTILKSSQTGLMQHDVYTWEVLGDKFVSDELTNSSEFIDKTITAWLQAVGKEQREQFIDTFFDILNATQVETFADLGNKKIQAAKMMLKAYKDLDEENKKMMFKTLSSLFEIVRSNISIPMPNILKNRK